MSYTKKSKGSSKSKTTKKRVKSRISVAVAKHFSDLGCKGKGVDWDLVERSYGQRKFDFLGVFDYIGVAEMNNEMTWDKVMCTLAVQVTSKSNVVSRVKKVLASKGTVHWLANPLNRAQVWGVEGSRVARVIDIFYDSNNAPFAKYSNNSTRLVGIEEENV